MLGQVLRDRNYLIVLTVSAFTSLLIALLIVLLVAIEPVIPAITETDIAPGQVHCRSEQVLTDDSGHKWSVMFFTEVDSPEVTSLNLRLSGLYSSANIQSQRPLIISTLDESYEATDIFLENPPLPSIGQYNLKTIFPRLVTADLTLEIPLEQNPPAHLHISSELLQEWQEVANKNYYSPVPFPKPPYTFELMLYALKD